VRQKPPHLRINNLEVGQNKLPKWAEYSCQTQLSNPHFRPDLIILDLNVPKISGTALLERWKSYRTPVVVFSSSMNPAARELCLASGAREFVSKPVELEEFQQAIGRIIEHWGTKRLRKIAR
jgi:CheY-like chemotaxis protein